MLTRTSALRLSRPVLVFANMTAEEITGANSVQKLFSGLQDPSRKVFDAGDEAAARAFRADHAMLLKHLELLRHGRLLPVRKFVAAEFFRDPHEMVVRLRIDDRKNSLVHFDVTEHQAIGVRTNLLLFLGELATQPSLLKRFGRCALPECALYFMKGAGRPSYFCTPQHQRRANKRGITGGPQ